MPNVHTQATPAATPPPMHPMDPRRGENLSPMFAAFLCWLIGLEPMTRPAITNVAVTGKHEAGAGGIDVELARFVPGAPGQRR